MQVDGRKAKGDRSRADILKHATRIASRDGLEHLTLGRVATDAGLAKGNIQVLFGDKETLQLATVESGIAIYLREVVEPALAQGTALKRIKALIDGWYTFVEERRLPGGCLVHALSNEYRTRPGAIRDCVEQHRTDAMHRLITLIGEAKAAGDLRSDTNAKQLAFELTAHQAAANVAALMGDEQQFELAKRTSRDRLRAHAVRS